MNKIKEYDIELYSCIEKELKRERNTLELIASENFTSNNVLETVGSILTNKYAEGYPGQRYYGGCEAVDEVENIAKDRLKNYLVQNMLMFNHIQVLRQIWPCI